MLYFSTDFLVGDFPVFSRVIARVRDASYSYFLQSHARTDIAADREPCRLTLAEQWNSLSIIIKGAFSSAEEASRCHKTAAQQLDLAQYALTSLVDELSAVMDVGARRREATIHVLDVQPPPLAPQPLDDAMAA